MSNSIILFGGGLDSAAMVEMLALIGSKPLLLYFDYGQKAMQGETRAMEYFSRKHKLPTQRVEVPKGIFPDSPLTNQAIATKHAQNYLPGRNMVFAALAFPIAVRIGASRIYLGASPADASSVFLDAKRAFATAFNTMLSLGYRDEVRLTMPLIEQNRESYLKKAMITEPDLFRVSFSCYESNTVTECGLCTHCAIKRDMQRKVNG